MRCSSILILLFYTLVGCSTAYGTDINSRNILNLFPICETPSSLGQRCKYDYAKTKPYGFLDVCCSDGANVEYKENSVSVLSSGNWYYNFDISRSSDGNYEIIFTDKAMNGGSYHSVTTFDAKIENGIILLNETDKKLF